MSRPGAGPRFGRPDDYGNVATHAARRPLTDEQTRQFVAALRDRAEARAREPARALAAPKKRAPGRDPCPFCEVPGFRGCAHFLPCEPVSPQRCDERFAARHNIGGETKNGSKPGAPRGKRYGGKWQ